MHAGDPSLSEEGDVTVERPVLGDDDTSNVRIDLSDEDDGASDDGHGHGSGMSMEALQRSSALFLMGLKETYKLTQTAVQGVIEGVTSLMQFHMSALHTHVNQQLTSSGVSPSVIGELSTLFSEDGSFGRPFHGLETQHQQLSFCRTHFNFIVRGLSYLW
jgi:hypothetical protein